MEQTNDIFRKKNTVKIYPKSLLVILILAALIIFEVRHNGSYLDEGLSVISTMLVVFRLKHFTRYDLISAGCVGVFVCLGLLSNLIFEIKPLNFSVMVDVVTQLKPFAVFFAVRYALTEREKRAVTDGLSFFARFYVVIVFILALWTLIYDTGMRGATRYGIYAFNFIFNYNYQYTFVSFLFLGAVLSSDKISEKRKNIYAVMSAISVALSLKSSGLVFALSFIFLFFYFQKYQKLNLKVILPLALLLLWASSFQIETYLLNENSARRVFIDYGFKTANDFFPLGSGFGTFGSAEAAKHYSNLYYTYGFDEIWGLSPTFGPFLSDTYWPMAIGQFGWIGAICFLAVYARMFIDVARSKATGILKAFLYAVFIQFIVHAVGSASLTSSAGMIAMAALSLYTLPDFEKEKKLQHYRIKISFR